MAKLVSDENAKRLARLLWGLVLLALPVTSFRFFPSFYGTTNIRPLAMFPLAFLFPLLVVNGWRNSKLDRPPGSKILLGLLFVILAATLIGGIFSPVNLHGQSYWGRVLRAWISLGVGLTFFISAFWMNRSPADLKHSLKWLYLSLIVTFIWGFAQILAINTSWLNYDLLNKVQQSISLGSLRNKRISGFTFEPSWLADLIVILYYPWSFSALITGYRLTRFRWFEPAMFLLASVLLVFTFSRGGILFALIVLTVIVAFNGKEHIRTLVTWIVFPFKLPRDLGFRKWFLAFGGRLILFAAASGVLVGVLFTFSENDYFSSTLDFSRGRNLLDYVINISAGPRLAYAIAGFEIFIQYPWTGVGLGGSGFYLYEHIPDWILTYTVEINRLFIPDSLAVPNSKNLYVRFLAETGLIGFWFFIAFYFSILGNIRALFSTAAGHYRYVGIAGLFIWLSVALRNFTQDSLTFPIMWVGFGMTLGFVHAFINQKNNSEEMEKAKISSG